MEDGSSRVSILGIDIAIPTPPIPTIPMQSIAPLPEDKLPIGVCEPSTEKVIELPQKDLFDSGSRLDGSKDVCCLDDDEIKSIHRASAASLVSRTPFDGLPSLKGDFDKLYATILQKGVDITPLETKSYSSRTSAEEHDNRRMEVQGKFDEASRWLNTESAHYEAKATELKQVELRRKELLKELQLLEDQKKDLSSQVAAS
ncbi:hypothetical protein Cgig2_009493 [Carnegiea gigantea]|uniref:Uncharacterized protein n=1 Tax=Carnegiea gigantea TaxID=171969 RepID=A0A9Q1GV72_9CARY|nr:hypothetical protein Cgig2_009493 [Carnegiea gigantea]